MKIAYVSHARFPTEKAHGHQMARVAEAFTKLGHTVTLVAPEIKNAVSQNHVTYYARREEYPVERLPVFDAHQSPLIPGRFAFLFTMQSYRGSLKEYSADHQFDLLYARSPHLLSALIATGIPVVLELHTLPRIGRSRFTALCMKCKRVVCLTSPMRDELAIWGVDRKKTIVEGDAVDLERFGDLPSRMDAKKAFDLPGDVPVVGYVGSLVTMDNVEKGVGLLLDAAVKLKSMRYPACMFIVGGPQEQLGRYRKLASQSSLGDGDIMLYGPIEAARVPEALAACDVCVYPAPDTKHPYIVRDTSPLKLFEYLAAGRPVVCADIPPVRDVLDASVVRFVRPGSATSLAAGIRDVLEYPKEAEARVEKGKALVKKHTWEQRMKRILKSVV